MWTAVCAETSFGSDSAVDSSARLGSGLPRVEFLRIGSELWGLADFDTHLVWLATACFGLELFERSSKILNLSSMVTVTLAANVS